MKKTSVQRKTKTSASKISNETRGETYTVKGKSEGIVMATVAGYRARKINIIEKLERRDSALKVINDLVETTGMNIKTLASYVYEMTPKTLSNYRQKGKVLPTRSLEVSIKLQELYSKGIELFDDRNRFNQWLQKESYGLGKRKPISLLNTASGIDLVYEELLRIEFGATA
ncbi:hypothetical protein ES705_33108 [subsurface metagenome]